MLQVIVNVLSQEKSPLEIWQAQRVIVVVRGKMEIWGFFGPGQMQSKESC